MINRDELKRAVATITNVDSVIGTNVLANFRRFIYRVKFTNLFAGVNLVTLGERINGAVGTTPIDYIQFILQYDLYIDPEELEDDAAPIYTIDGAGATGASNLYAVGSAAGNVYFTYWYIDAEA